MTVQHVRPDVSQLAIRLYDRALHPELFEAVAQTRIARDGFEATLRICNAGHVLEVRQSTRQVTEIIGEASQALPARGRTHEYSLQSARDVDAVFDGLVYCNSSHIEHLDPEVFEDVQTELLGDARHAVLAYEFPRWNRMQEPGLSVIQADANARCLLIQCFHTFPESDAVLRSQSLFQF